MAIALPRPADFLTRAIVYKKELLTPDVCRLQIEPATQVYYRAGQFVNLQRPDGLTRSYSLASVPHDDYYMEMHIKRVADGKMSQWIFEDLKEDDEIEFHGPLGDCYYTADDEKHNLLMISTGTGVAPHLGIVKDALLSGYKGEIKLYHGAQKQHESYPRESLEALVQKYSNFSYILCSDDEAEGQAIVIGNPVEVALEQNADISGWRVYLSGQPEMVTNAERAVIALGVAPENVQADPFEYDHGDVKDSSSVTEDKSVERRKFPDPDPEMWQALDNGKLMLAILTSFYTHVFEDELLSPYFKGVTRQRLIEKVYNFHYQMFTGEKVYFGERPRNAHHWMVISDELFDYRESIMEEALREHGLAEHLIKRWIEYEQMYRDDIVKSQPIKKILFGQEMPLEGFEEMVMDVSTLCDSCSGEINIGDMVRYHIRMGTMYCTKCMQKEDASS